jgi:predicted DCC family thiol-disulfide oxidoreductase YuxK
VDQAPVLLYDGTCGFCSESVQLVLRHDRRGTVRFAALDSAFAAAVKSRHPGLAGLDSMLWVEPASAAQPERVFARSSAGLAVARYLGGVWRAALLAWLLPRPLRDGLYDFVARHRHRLPGACPVHFAPGPEVRDRFLP